MARPHRVFIPPHPDDACARKVRYTTEIAARMGAQSVLTNPNLSPPPRMWVYCCQVCDGWHCTKREHVDVPAVTKRDLYAQVGAHAERGDALAAPFMGDAVGRQADAPNTPSGLWRDRLLMGDCSVRSSTVVRGKL